MNKFDQINANLLAKGKYLIIAKLFLMLATCSLIIKHNGSLSLSVDNSAMLAIAKQLYQNEKNTDHIQNHNEVAHVHDNSCAFFGSLSIL